MHYLIPIIVFLGLPVGKLIGYYTKDELEQGRIYFYAAKKIVLFSIFIVITLTLNLGLANILAFAAGLFSYKLFKLDYFWLGLGLASSQTVLIPSTLIFVHGLIYSALNKSFIKETILFFLPFTLLLIPVASTLLASLASGAILSNTLFGE